MKLVAFSVSNYRSIVKGYKLSLGNYTVFVGPNNEGKSNILKAIELSLGVLVDKRQHLIRHSNETYRIRYRGNYDWDRDYPLSLRDENPEGRSSFTLEFQLTEDEIEEFQNEFSITLNSNLSLRLFFSQRGITIEILRKGPGKKRLNENRDKIINFINRRISVQYISALRPSEMALNVVNRLIEGELYSLEDSPEYNKLIQQIQNLQQPILDKISDRLRATVTAFIPKVKNISITNERLGRSFRTSFNINVDDGVDTDLSLKGDGIISLTTMSLMRHVSEESASGKSLILLIEEPESHLHPDAIHGLRKVLKDISSRQQVIITTHSPILVEREIVTRNILVKDGHAIAATKIEDIRSALGIQMADNLVGAYIVLLVEGEEDQKILSKWIRSLSTQIKDALNSNILIVDHLAGASNLHYKATFYKNNIYNIHVYFDNDDAGRRAIEDAIDKKTLDQNDYHLANCEGWKNSEIEDLVKLDVYAEEVKAKYGVDLSKGHVRSSKKKWSERVEKAFKDGGKLWNATVRRELKMLVALTCEKEGINSLNTHHRGSVDALVSSLEIKLAARKQ